MTDADGGKSEQKLNLKNDTVPPTTKTADAGERIIALVKVGKGKRREERGERKNSDKEKGLCDYA